MNSDIIKKIIITEYNPTWPQIFQTEAKNLKKSLKDTLIAIHHIGSTSIPDMSAKPQIDIIVVLKSFVNTIPKLEILGYKYRGELNIPFRLFFKKNIFNLHVHQSENPEIQLNLLFRDYLREKPNLCKEYSNLKQELIKQKSMHPKNDRVFVNYTLAKNDFIKKILEQAGFTRLCLRICMHQDEWNDYHKIRKKEIFGIPDITYNPAHYTMSDPHHVHLVLYLGVQIIGIAQIEFKNSDLCVLRTLAIDFTLQHQGYGTHLLQLLEKWIKTKHIKMIYLNTDTHTIPFYKKLGYHATTFEDPDGLNLEDKTSLSKVL